MSSHRSPGSSKTPTLSRSRLGAIRRWTVFAPITGGEASGKSALINALIGAPLLPVGITATTVVPTELSFGENNVCAYRGNLTQQLGLADLRTQPDLTGATRLNATYRCPFLAEIPMLRLIDLPGLGVGPPDRERVVRGALPEPCACLLVFSADDPVVRESEAVFLRELQLKEAQFYPVMTKCDKQTPQELKQATAFLHERLTEIYGASVEIACVSARGDVEPVRKLLRTLQALAAQLKRGRLASVLPQAAAQLHARLQLRMDTFGLAAPLFARSVELMEERARLLAEPLEAEAQRLQEDSGSWERSLPETISKAVLRAQPSLEAMLISGQNPTVYVDDTLRATVQSSLRGELLPLIRSYLRGVTALLRLSQNDGESVELETDALMREAFLDFPQSSMLFTGILRTTRGVLWGQRKEALHEMLTARLLSELAAPAEQFAVQTGKTLLAAAQRAAGEAVQLRSSALHAALEEFKRRGEPDEAHRGAVLRELHADLEKVELVLKACRSQASRGERP